MPLSFSQADLDRDIKWIIKGLRSQKKKKNQFAECIHVYSSSCFI